MSGSMLLIGVTAVVASVWAVVARLAGLDARVSVPLSFFVGVLMGAVFIALGWL